MRWVNAWWRRLTDWSHWPFGLFYLPLLPVWLWYCVKGRSFWFFSTSNPRIPFGGFEGEGKRDVYAQLPPSSYPRTAYAEPHADPASVLRDVTEHGITFPLIVKPDIGMEGIGVRRLENADALHAYHTRMRVPYLVQELADLPHEVSVFYYRYPGAIGGHITGFLNKIFPVLTGDGISTTGDLIGQQAFSPGFLEHLRKTHHGNWQTILAAGKKLELSVVGNRYFGVRFEDCSGWISPAMVEAFDRLSHFSGAIFYGRYDLKCRSLPDMSEGRHFTILEFNGAGAIPNHVYAGRYTLLRAYREIGRHWHHLFEISRQNLKLGEAGISFREGLRLLLAAKKHFRALRRLQKRRDL